MAVAMHWVLTKRMCAFLCVHPCWAWKKNSTYQWQSKNSQNIKREI